VRQAEPASKPIRPGTLMQKAIPPRLVEPYLTGRRSVIAGFVYQAKDCSFRSPAELSEALDLGYEGSDLGPEITEVYVLRWTAVTADSFSVPYSPELGGDWRSKPPFTGTGYTSSRAHSIAEYYTDPIPVPVGAEMYRLTQGAEEFIARFDGQAWLRPSGGI
jgi:hypothetical protein